MNNPYIKTEWHDHIVDVETGETIQEGTRFTARRANNIEEGIYNAHENIEEYKKEIDKLRIQLELTGRAPSHNGSFFDPLNGEEPRQLRLQTSKAIAQEILNAGDTVIQLNDVPFKTGDVVTVFDEENQESVQIDTAGESSITVNSLSNTYKKGAYVVRTNAIMDSNINEIGFGSWGTLTITAKEVV